MEDWDEVNKPRRKRNSKVTQAEAMNDLSSAKEAEAGGKCKDVSIVKLRRKERRKRRRIEELAGQKIPGGRGEGGGVVGRSIRMAKHQDTGAERSEVVGRSKRMAKQQGTGAKQKVEEKEGGRGCYRMLISFPGSSYPITPLSSLFGAER